MREQQRELLWKNILEQSRKYESAYNKVDHPGPTHKNATYLQRTKMMSRSVYINQLFSHYLIFKYIPTNVFYGLVKDQAYCIKHGSYVVRVGKYGNELVSLHIQDKENPKYGQRNNVKFYPSDVIVNVQRTMYIRCDKNGEITTDVYIGQKDIYAMPNPYGSNRLAKLSESGKTRGIKREGKNKWVKLDQLLGFSFDVNELVIQLRAKLISKGRRDIEVYFEEFQVFQKLHIKPHDQILSIDIDVLRPDKVVASSLQADTDLYYYLSDNYDRLKKDPNFRISLMREVQSATAALNSQGVSHQDIKAENYVVWNGEFGPEVRVTDLDMATKEKSINDFIGTLSYFPPEKISLTQFDPMAADIFALGIVFHEINYGGFPYLAQDDRSLNDWKDAQDRFYKQGSWEAIWKRGSELDKLIYDMLHWDPKKRPDHKQISETLERAQLAYIKSTSAPDNAMIIEINNPDHSIITERDNDNEGRYNQCKTLLDQMADSSAQEQRECIEYLRRQDAIPAIPVIHELVMESIIEQHRNASINNHSRADKFARLCRQLIELEPKEFQWCLQKFPEYLSCQFPDNPIPLYLKELIYQYDQEVKQRFSRQIEFKTDDVQHSSRVGPQNIRCESPQADTSKPHGQQKAAQPQMDQHYPRSFSIFSASNKEALTHACGLGNKNDKISELHGYV